MKALIHRYLPLALGIVLIGQGCVSVGGGPATIGSAGMFVSTDNAESWRSISLLPTTEGVRDISGSDVYKLITDPQDPKALYWATRADGYYFSYDEGRSWARPLGSELQTGFVFGLTVDPRDKCTIYATNGIYTYKSVDCSRSWEEVYREGRPGVQVVAILFKPNNPRIIFMATSNGDFLESRDAGFSWRTLHRFNHDLRDIFVSPASPDTIFVTSRTEGLFRSTDGGRTWAALSLNMKDFPGAKEYRRFVAIPNARGHLYYASKFGLLRSTDNGDTWKEISLITPAGVAQIWGLSVNPDNEKEIYYTATIENRSTMYKSADGGETWTTNRLPSGQVPTMIHVLPKSTGETLLYLGFTVPPKQ